MSKDHGTSDEIGAEIEFHIDMRTRDLIAQGMPPEEARAEAVRRFGNVEAVRGAIVRASRAPLWSVVVLVTLGVCVIMQRILSYFTFYRGLYKAFPFYVPESLKNGLEVAVCVAALLALGERHLRRGLFVDRRVVRGLLFGVACTLPMFAGFVMTRHSDVRDLPALFYLAFFSPFVEEIVTRGFAFGTLRRLGWPLWPAVAVCAMVTGLAHIEKGQNAAQILGLFILPGIGGAVFCWLLHRWGSLWFPWALHAMMNFWWEVFNVAPTALGGWFAFVLQNGSVLLAILITFKFTRSLNGPRVAVTPGGPDARERGERTDPASPRQAISLARLV